MTEIQKGQIVDAMSAYIRDKSITSTRFAEIAGVSASYITHLAARNWNEIPVGKGKFSKISDKVFQHIIIALGMSLEDTYWGHFDTENYMEAIVAIQDARTMKGRCAIDGPTGFGKTYTAEKYKHDNPAGTYIVKCADDLSAKGFMLEFAEVAKVKITGGRAVIRKAIVRKLGAEKDAIVIFDEVENMKDGTYGALKAICDDLEGKVTIVLMGANNYEKKLARKAQNERGCFPQIYRRFKNGFVRLSAEFDLQEVTDICTELGITAKGVINLIFDRCLNMGELNHLVVKLKRVAHEQDCDITPDFVKQVFPAR